MAITTEKGDPPPASAGVATNAMEQNTQILEAGNATDESTQIAEIKEKGNAKEDTKEKKEARKTKTKTRP